MSDGEKTLPIVIATSVVRGSQQGESHGGIYLVDFEKQDAKIMVDWNESNIDFSGRGWDRGLRGIEFYGDEIFIAASDELFVYDQTFDLENVFPVKSYDELQTMLTEHYHGVTEDSVTEPAQKQSPKPPSEEEDDLPFDDLESTSKGDSKSSTIDDDKVKELLDTLE